MKTVRVKWIAPLLLLAAGCKSERPEKAPNPAPVASVIPDSSLLLCRGGPPAVVSSRLDVSGPAKVDVDGLARDYLAGIITADITIVKQAGSAGKDGALLDPGSCAYPDRSMYDSEPRVLRHYRHDTRVVVTWATRNGASTAPVLRTFVDDFVTDPAAIIRVQLHHDLDGPGVSRILEWEDVTATKP